MLDVFQVAITFPYLHQPPAHRACCRGVACVIAWNCCGLSTWGHHQGGYGTVGAMAVSPMSAATVGSIASAHSRYPLALGCSKSGINSAGMEPSGRRKSVLMSM